MTAHGRDADSALGQVDRYLLLRELGSGSFGTVYLARDTVALTEVAVKALPNFLCHSGDEMEQIQRNFALVARLHHPHVASLLHLHCIERIEWFEPAGDRPFAEHGDYLVVMEYAAGITLSRLRRSFPNECLPVPAGIELCRQIASALDFAHSQNIVHRDVKPSNIVVRQAPDGSAAVKVLDFGLAAEIHSSMTRVTGDSGNTGGTRPYMAPEQWAGKIQDGCADQYALAVSFHELVCGHVPFASIFETNDTLLMLNVVRSEIPDPLPQLTSVQNAVLLRALSKDPAQRYPTCSDFIEGLARGDVGSAVGGAFVQRVDESGTGASWVRPVLLGALGASLVAAVLLLSQLFQENGRAEDVARERVRVESLRSLVQEARAALDRKDLGTVRRVARGLDVGLSELSPTAPEATLLHNQLDQLRLDARTLGIRLAGEAFSHARPYYHRIQKIDPAGNPRLRELYETGRTSWQIAEEQLRNGDHVAVTQACAQVEQAALLAEPMVQALAARDSALAAREQAPPYVRAQALRVMGAAEQAWRRGNFVQAETEWRRAASIWNSRPPPPVAPTPRPASNAAVVDLRREAVDLLKRLDAGADWDGIWIDESRANTAVAVATRKLKAWLRHPTPTPQALREAIEALETAAGALRSSRKVWGQSLAESLVSARADGRWAEVQRLAGTLAAGVADAPLGHLEEEWRKLASDAAATARRELRPRLAIRTRFQFPGLTQEQSGARVQVSPDPLGWSGPAAVHSETQRGVVTTPCEVWLDPGLNYTVSVAMEDPIPAGGKMWRTRTWHTNLVATWGGLRELDVLLQRKVLPDDLVALPPAAAASDQMQAAARLRIPVQVRSAVMRLDLVLVPPGQMRILPHGSKRTVALTLDHPLYCAPVETTRDQWVALVNQQRLPPVRPFFTHAPHDAPMENVSWEEARAFCLALCRAEGVPEGTYRLPTEAEWEYICRAGGPPVAATEASTRGLENSSVLYEGGQLVPPRRVGPYSGGRLAPNRWGIYDTLGSVWEWCDVWSLPVSGGNMSPFRPMQSESSGYISRGGSFLEGVQQITSASRRVAPMVRENHTGFRIVRDMPRTPGAVQ